jgi:hypothetical protein
MPSTMPSGAPDVTSTSLNSRKTRKRKYGGVDVAERQRLKEFERENARLKRMYADQALELTAIRDVLNRKQ